MTLEEMRLLREVELIISKQPEKKPSEQKDDPGRSALEVHVSDVKAI